MLKVREKEVARERMREMRGKRREGGALIRHARWHVQRRREERKGKDGIGGFYLGLTNFKLPFYPPFDPNFLFFFQFGTKIQIFKFQNSHFSPFKFNEFYTMNMMCV